MNAHVVIAGTKSDCHSVGIKLLELELVGQGYSVRNIGPCSTASEIAQAASEEGVIAVLIGSQNGHAYPDLSDLPDQMTLFGVDETPVFLGGNLTVGSEKDSEEIADKFGALGVTILSTFDEVVVQLKRIKESTPGRERVELT